MKTFLFLIGILILSSCGEPNGGSSSSQSSSGGSSGMSLSFGKAFVFVESMGRQTLPLYGDESGAHRPSQPITVFIDNPVPDINKVEWYINGYLVDTKTQSPYYFESYYFLGWRFGEVSYRAKIHRSEGSVEEISAMAVVYLTNYKSPVVTVNGYRFTFAHTESYNYRSYDPYDPNAVAEVYLAGDFNGWLPNDINYRMNKMGDVYVITTANAWRNNRYKFCVYVTNSEGVLDTMPKWVHDMVNYRMENSGFETFNSLVHDDYQP